MSEIRAFGTRTNNAVLLADVAAALRGSQGSNWVVRCEAAALLAGVVALLPDCPRCGGTGYTKWYEWGAKAGTGDPCPASCVDGKVPVAQLAALWEAVHADDVEVLQSHDAVSLLEQLREVRP